MTKSINFAMLILKDKMSPQEFANVHNIFIFEPDSVFPPIFAVHTIGNEKVLQNDYLLSSDLTKKPNLALKIDKLLQSTQYVFFSLGKGYLKTKNCVGLIYDPHVLVKINGANFVRNDLLYELEKSELIKIFIVDHQKELENLLSIYDQMILNELIKTEILPKDAQLQELIKIFRHGVDKKLSPLIFSGEKHKQYVCLSEQLIELLDDELKDFLSAKINEQIVQKFTLTENLDEVIEQEFSQNKKHLNLFFNQAKQEIMPEIRIPLKHKITDGLIGIYIA